jgi:hypothetical protein
MNDECTDSDYPFDIFKLFLALVTFKLYKESTFYLQDIHV